MNDRRWWTVRQVAEHYGMSVRTVYAEIETGRLVSHRFGGSRGAIRVADVDRLEWETNSRRKIGDAPPRQTFRMSPGSAHLVEKHLQL